MATSSPAADRTPTPQPGSPFPRKTALAALCTVGLLAGWHHFRDPAAGLSPSIFAQAARLQLPHAPVASSPNLPLSGVQTPGHSQAGLPRSASGTTDPAAAPISPFLIDDSHALDPFFAALHALERGGAPEVVTILHYGDSPTTADLITGDARALLQARFGDAGHGFNLAGKPWAWYGHRDVLISDRGWKSLTGVGSMHQAVYGLGGATLVGGTDAHSTFKLLDGAQTSAELQYLSEPGGGTVTVSAGDQTLATISTDGAADTPADFLIQLPPGTRELSLDVTSGTVRLLGIDFRRGSTGVLYDSLGLNGASTTVISRTFAPGPWAAELRHARPSLVILNYGTNESSFGSFVQKQYEGELRLAVAKLRSALPDVPILIMSPMDRGERGGLNEIHTMATIPEIVAIQRRVAADLRCAFFDTFDAMGGNGTFSRWSVAKPRLVTADLIHPTPQGATVVAQQLVNNLMLGYDRWKRSHGVTPGAATAGGGPQAPSVRPRSAGAAGLQPGPPQSALRGKPSAGVLQQPTGTAAPATPPATTGDDRTPRSAGSPVAAAPLPNPPEKHVR